LDWPAVLELFEANERRLVLLGPAEPMPEAEFCRESAHRTLGHLTACQVAWLPLLHRIRDGAASGRVALHPLRLYDHLGFATTPWTELLERFATDRREWRELLNVIDLDHPLKTPTKVLTARTLTEKLVQHEAMHLQELQAHRNGERA